MATLTTIGSPVWGMSVYGYGVIVEGITAIRQRMDLAIRTTKGSDPLRPEFGSNVYLYIDAPVNVADPNIKREILDCLDTWVPDIKVTGIKSYLKDLSNLVFEITFRLVDDSLTQVFVFDPNSGIVSSVNTEIVLQAFFPANSDGLRYQFQFIKNGLPVMPLQSVEGFATIAGMFDFMQTNYAYLGKWFLTSDRIVSYIKSDGIKSISLSLSVLENAIRFQALFPQLLEGQHYQLQLIFNDELITSPAEFLTPGAALAWANANWSQYATWRVEYFKSGVLAGEFSDEFSSDFDIDVDGDAYYLIGFSLVPGVKAVLGILNA